MTTTKRIGGTTEHIGRRELRSEPLKSIVRTAPASIQAGSTIGAAIVAMQQQEGDSLLILVGDRLRGILTERDIVLKVLARGVDPEALVDGFMTPDPDTLTPDSSLVDALELMDRRGYRSVPLVDRDGHIAGVVRQGDILAFVAEAFPQEILNLPPRPDQVLDRPEGG